MNATAFIIGNGESRLQFNIDNLKGKGTIYGCNAIYRDHPYLCDNIVAVNYPMYMEIHQMKQEHAYDFNLLGVGDVENWNYTVNGENLKKEKPNGATYYRIYSRGKKTNITKRVKDFTKTKGSGCTAVLHAALQGYKKIVLLGFDMIGKIDPGKNEFEHWQNNVYKNSINYPARAKQKSYLIYEWLFHLTQTFKRFPQTDFFLFNSKINLDHNDQYKLYFSKAPGNVRCGTYDHLSQMLQGQEQNINWVYY